MNVSNSKFPTAQEISAKLAEIRAKNANAKPAAKNGTYTLAKQFSAEFEPALRAACAPLSPTQALELWAFEKIAEFANAKK